VFCELSCIRDIGKPEPLCPLDEIKADLEAFRIVVKGTLDRSVVLAFEDGIGGS